MSSYSSVWIPPPVESAPGPDPRFMIQQSSGPFSSYPKEAAAVQPGYVPGVSPLPYPGFANVNPASAPQWMQQGVAMPDSRFTAGINLFDRGGQGISQAYAAQAAHYAANPFPSAPGAGYVPSPSSDPFAGVARLPGGRQNATTYEERAAMAAAPAPLFPGFGSSAPPMQRTSAGFGNTAPASAAQPLFPGLGSGASAGPSPAVRDAFGSMMAAPPPPSGQTAFTDASTVGSRYASFAPTDPNPRWDSAAYGPRVSTAPVQPNYGQMFSSGFAVPQPSAQDPFGFGLGRRGGRRHSTPRGRRKTNQKMATTRRRRPVKAGSVRRATMKSKRRL